MVLKVFIFIFVILCLSSAYGQSSRCELPKSVSQTVARRWDGWNLLQVQDLRPDDQHLWRKKWNDACPSVVKGHFLASSKLSYAFSLINRKDNQQQVILATPAGGGSFNFQTLSKPTHVAGFAVLYRLQPGTYQEVEGGRTVRTKLDSIADETIEAAVVMFYEEQGSFHSMLLSE